MQVPDRTYNALRDALKLLLCIWNGSDSLRFRDFLARIHSAYSLKKLGSNADARRSDRERKNAQKHQVLNV